MSLSSERDLADLDARRGLQLEARDHRARIGADHLRVDAEVLELEFDLPRQRLQRFLAVALGLRLGIVEQRQRRNARCRRRRGTAGSAARAWRARSSRRPAPAAARSCTGARLARSSVSTLRASSRSSRKRARLLPFGRLLRAAAEQRARSRAAPTAPIRSITANQRQPGGQRDRHQQQREQEQVAAEPAEHRCIERIADQLAEDAAATRRQVRRRAAAQVQQAGGRDQEADDADQTQRRTEVGVAVAVAYPCRTARSRRSRRA